MSVFHFPATDSTLVIVLLGVPGRAGGILLGSYHSVLLLSMYSRLVVLQYKKTSLLWPGLYCSCPFRLYFPLLQFPT